jgi:hypothetical protein
LQAVPLGAALLRLGVVVEDERGGGSLLAADEDGEADDGDDELADVDQQAG